MQDRPTPTPPRLLAIDDDEMIHRLLKTRLRDERIEIHSAIDGCTGLNMIKSMRPDVVLLDVDMPGMNGFDVLREIKSDTEIHDIPVILLSGSCDTAGMVYGLDAGAVDFITKPFDLAELKARVRSAIRLHQMMQMLAQTAHIDGLTGLWNRTYFDRRLDEVLSLAVRHHSKVSLIMCDLDRFKQVNDTYGHPFGDQVLQVFAGLLHHGRKGDVSCRYGGEEFTIIMPRTDASEAARLAERIASHLRSLCWQGHSEFYVTASFGVADLNRVVKPTPAAMIEAADKALYAAKQAGRDRVELAPEIDKPVRLSA